MARTPRSPRPKFELEKVRPPLDERKMPPVAVPARTIVSPEPSVERVMAVTAVGPCQKSIGCQVMPPFVLRITPLPRVPAKRVWSLANWGEATRV